MLELVRVSKYRGSPSRRGTPPDAILDDISLRVEPGELVMVNGAMASGKTTLVSLIIGTLAPDAGRVGVFGHDVGRLRRSSIARLRRRIGIIPQNPRLLDHRTALDNVRLPLEVQAASRRESRARATDALASVGLESAAAVRVTELSAGERQRVAIARAIVTDPELVVADEPTAHLDTASAREMVELLSILQIAGATGLIATGDRAVLDWGAMSGWRRFDLIDGQLDDAAADVDVTGVIEVDDDYAELDVVEPAGEIEVPAPNVVPFPVAR